MASYRRLPNRKWQATVLLPVRLSNGQPKRKTKTHPSKGVLREWANDLEARIVAGNWSDTGGEVTLRDYYQDWAETRVVSDATTSKATSHWRNHVEPAFGGHPVRGITRQAVRSWVKRMETEQCARCLAVPELTKAGVLAKHKTSAGKTCSGSGEQPGLGAWTIQGAVSTLSSILSQAAEDGMLAANPAAGIRLPRVDPKPVFFWTKDQAAKIARAAADVDPMHGLMIDLDMHVGLRLGELTGLKRRYVDLQLGTIAVAAVQTRTGWREYPKSKLSRRMVPIPPRLLEDLREQCEGLGPDDIVFPSPTGGAWDDTNFRSRVFDPAVKAAGVPRGTPHDMRHTAASWLVQRGVDLYRVQALLGHESFRTTQRYAHLAPGHFDQILGAWD